MCVMIEGRRDLMWSGSVLRECGCHAIDENIASVCVYVESESMDMSSYVCVVCGERKLIDHVYVSLCVCLSLSVCVCVCMCVYVYSMHLEGVLSLLSELEDAEAESSEADAVLQRLVRRNRMPIPIEPIVPITPKIEKVGLDVRRSIDRSTYIHA